uniref:trafficking protein particle complex subunit 1 isoform 6 n=1 Tax=Mus musculus TaxID=10090 RepID=UPI0039BF4DC7
MTVHNLYLFDRNGVCLHYSEWHRKKQAGIPKEELYVEFVVKNPLCPLGQTVQSELFRSRLDSYVRSLPFFSARAG